MLQGKLGCEIGSVKSCCFKNKMDVQMRILLPEIKDPLFENIPRTYQMDFKTQHYYHCKLGEANSRDDL